MANPIIGFLLASCVFIFLNWGYIYCELGLFFLPDEYLSFVADKIWERGGGDLPYHSSFFPQIQIFFSYSFRFVSWRVSGLHTCTSMLGQAPAITHLHTVQIMDLKTYHCFFPMEYHSDSTSSNGSIGWKNQLLGVLIKST